MLDVVFNCVLLLLLNQHDEPPAPTVKRVQHIKDFFFLSGFKSPASLVVAERKKPL